MLFHPLVYILKLHIEMNIADLIVRVVKATSDNKSYGNETELRSKRTRGAIGEDGSVNRTTNGRKLDHFGGAHVDIEVSSGGYNKGDIGGGITKVVHTRVTSKRCDESEDGDNGSESLASLKERMPNGSFV